MALFRKTKKVAEIVDVVPVEAQKVALPPRRGADVMSVLIKPRITEKAAGHHEQSVYVFDVSKEANAYMVAAAVKAQFKVAPRKVNIVMIPTKNVVVRGRRGTKGGGKKAYVYLKKGEKIELV